jgi:8-oxo-dGTP diphosphatase
MTACTCGIGGHDHSADCAVEVAARSAIKAPIPIAFTLVIYDSKVLLGLRCGTQAADMWGWPGGKADRPGSMAYNAAEELAEEVNLRVDPDRLLRFDMSNEWVDETTGQCYPETLFWLPITAAEKVQIQGLEPDKHSEWRWFDPRELPENLFAAEKRAIRRLFWL